MCYLLEFLFHSDFVSPATSFPYGERVGSKRLSVTGPSLLSLQPLNKSQSLGKCLVSGASFCTIECLNIWNKVQKCCATEGVCHH